MEYTFQNTLRAASECQDILEAMQTGQHAPLSPEELRAAKALIQVCYDIVSLVAEATDTKLDELDEHDSIEEGVDELQSCTTESKGS